MDEIKRIDRTLITKGRVIDYYQDTMQMPDGSTVKWDLIDHVGAAAVVAVREDGKILMVRQYRNPLDRQTLEIPAGKLD
ncbi:MAG: NUDIX hydrolase, partial [Lachnospiraceae bacterium]|nr:NUDIX hydrolase [Lachnospiraceae bacterium]